MDNIVELIAGVNSSVVHLVGGVDTTEIVAGGLNQFWNNILKNWITPIFIAMVAVFALFFIKDRAWMKLIGFVGIAAVVGVLVFAGGDLFGGKNKGLTKTAKGLADNINTVNTTGGFVELENKYSE